VFNRKENNAELKQELIMSVDGVVTSTGFIATLQLSNRNTVMPLWLWQEVQILPWSTEIVALTCGTRNSLRPPYSSVHGKFVAKHRPRPKRLENCRL
jgi:hypothetical protein